MAKNANLRFIALIGGIFGVIAILVGLFPSDASWWYIKANISNYNIFLNPFGYFATADNEFLFSGDYLILISGLIFLLGSILVMYGAFKEQKGIAIISAVLMIVGLVIFCVALNTKANWEDVRSYLSFLNNQGNLLAGSGSFFLINYNWNLGIGFYLGAVGAGIGIIGAFVMD